MMQQNQELPKTSKDFMPDHRSAGGTNGIAYVSLIEIRTMSMFLVLAVADQG